MPLPVLLVAAAKIAAPIIVAGVGGKLYHSSKKSNFEEWNPGEDYKFSNFAKDVGSDLGRAAKRAKSELNNLHAEGQKYKSEGNSAYNDSKGYSNSELRDRYEKSSGAEKSGYGKALKERLDGGDGSG